ncbi:cholesterol 7-desaturase [Plasmodiophora brassicae]
MSLLVVALSIDGPACRRIFFEGADAVGAGAVCVQWREEIYRKRQRAARRRNRIIAVFSSLSSSMATECEPGRLQFILASLSAACCLWFVIEFFRNRRENAKRAEKASADGDQSSTFTPPPMPLVDSRTQPLVEDHHVYNCPSTEDLPTRLGVKPISDDGGPVNTFLVLFLCGLVNFNIVGTASRYALTLLRRVLVYQVHIAVAVVVISVLYVSYKAIVSYRARVDEAKRKVDIAMSVAGSARRMQSGFPPAFPNGWYKVALSEEVDVGQVIYVKCLGLDLAVFRGEDGHAGVVGAYCPHMGANVAVGGRVKGNCVECPFHLWTFDRSGKCTGVPYSERKAPEKASLKKYEAIEYHMVIMIWYHADDEPSTYYPPLIPEIADGRFVYGGRVRRDMKMHVFEIAENSVDYAHFQTLHHSPNFPLLRSLFSITHKITWTRSPDPSKPQEMFMTDEAYLVLCGIHLPVTSSIAHVHFCGASVLYFTFWTPLGRVALLKTARPEAPFYQLVEDVWFRDPRLPYFVGAAIASIFYYAFSEDDIIWENKAWETKPWVVQGDGPLTKVRPWEQQFFSAGSARKSAEACGQFEW